MLGAKDLDVFVDRGARSSACSCPAKQDAVTGADLLIASWMLV